MVCFEYILMFLLYSTECLRLSTTNYIIAKQNCFDWRFISLKLKKYIVEEMIFSMKYIRRNSPNVLSGVLHSSIIKIRWKYQKNWMCLSWRCKKRQHETLPQEKDLCLWFASGRYAIWISDKGDSNFLLTFLTNLVYQFRTLYYYVALKIKYTVRRLQNFQTLNVSHSMKFINFKNMFLFNMHSLHFEDVIQ